MKTHTQCTMMKGRSRQTAWIPSHFAIRGNFVKLKGDDGWEITDVGTVMSSDRVKENNDRLHRGVFGSLK